VVQFLQGAQGDRVLSTEGSLFKHGIVRGTRSPHNRARRFSLVAEHLIRNEEAGVRFPVPARINSIEIFLPGQKPDEYPRIPVGQEISWT
jgi:hypothetical protein